MCWELGGKYFELASREASIYLLWVGVDQANTTITAPMPLLQVDPEMVV
jgi:hypothetical protein